MLNRTWCPWPPCEPVLLTSQSVCSPNCFFDSSAPSFVFPPDPRSSLWSQLCPEGSLPTLNLSKPLSLTSKHTERTAPHLNQCLFSSVHHDLPLIITQTDSRSCDAQKHTRKLKGESAAGDTSTLTNAGTFEAHLPSSVISKSSNRDWLQMPSKQS